MAWTKERGSSLKILEVENFSLSDKEILPPQSDLCNEIAHTGSLPTARTEIKYEGGWNGYKKYFVKQYTPTIKETIRVAIEGIKDWEQGYQRKAEFNIIHDVKRKLLYIFSSKEHTNYLRRRLTKLPSKVSLKEIEFNFLDMKIPQVHNIWGVWEEVNLGHIATEGKFGHQVDKDIHVNLKRASTLHFKLHTDTGKEYDMALSKDGRIGSKNKIDKKEMLDLFHRYFYQLIK